MRQNKRSGIKVEKEIKENKIMLMNEFHLVK